MRKLTAANSLPRITAIERAAPTTPLVGAAPRPWRLDIETDARGRRSMVVYAADGEVVEHRTAGGFTPEIMARHIANARHYIAAVNAQESG